MRDLLDKKDPLAPDNTRFYPPQIFGYLFGECISQEVPPPAKSLVDVILYPFTADVSGQPDDDSARKLAAQLRRSASRALLDLISGERGSLDFNWYIFLMGKTNLHYVPQSLEEIPTDQNRQIILVDTAVSGRAAYDITLALNELGHLPNCILAANNLGGRKLQPNLITAISCQSECYLCEFPLVTEDAGAALLGVAAVNFSDFNQPGIFHKIDSRFPPGFLPQSCIWALPPPPLHQIYQEAFHGFLKYCYNPLGVSNWPEVKQRITQLIKSSRG